MAFAGRDKGGAGHGAQNGVAAACRGEAAIASDCTTRLQRLVIIAIVGQS
jgi:hypothetical protein